MQKDLFQDLPEAARRQALEDQAYRIEEKLIKRPFSKDELDHFKNEISETMIEVNDIEEELSDIKKEFKAKMDPLKIQVKENLKNVRLKYSEEEGEVFLLADHVEGVMSYYDSKGVFLESRPLMLSEKQITIVQMTKQA